MTPDGPRDGAQPLKILFVCLGNICRSPLAENVFRQLLTEKGLAEAVEVDSAGTGDWHVGEAPHQRTRAVAARRGVEVVGAARQVAAADLERFDYVIAMDGSNLSDLRALQGSGAADTRLHLLREFEDDAEDLDVPDPYGGGADGFERVHDVVERACQGLLEHLLSEHDLGAR